MPKKPEKFKPTSITSFIVPEKDEEDEEEEETDEETEEKILMETNLK